MKLSTSLRSMPTRAVIGMNRQAFYLTDGSRKMSWSWSCVNRIALKVRHDDRSRKKYALISMLPAFFPKRP